MIRTTSAVLFTLAATLPAQRTTAELAWKKHEIAVDYGAVRVGNHSLEKLPVGSDWRMGMNQASQIRLDVPLVAGDAVAAPGSYRAKIYRAGEKELHLMVDGGGHAIGAKNDSVMLAGTLAEPTGKPTKKLELAWAKPKKTGETELTVRFGPTTLDVPVVALDATKKKGKAYTAMVFRWPTELLDARVEKSLPSPIATLTPKKKPKKDMPTGYNLIVAGKSATLIPLMSAPTSSFGFGEVVKPDAKHVVEGKIEWSEEQGKPGKEMKLVSYTATKKEVSIEFVVGTRRAKATFEM